MSPAMILLTHTNFPLSMEILVNNQQYLPGKYNQLMQTFFSGAAQDDVKEKSGQERYNAKITSVWSEEMGEGMKQMTEALSGLCVILEGGEKIYGKGKHNHIMVA